MKFQSLKFQIFKFKTLNFKVKKHFKVSNLNFGSFKLHILILRSWKFKENQQKILSQTLNLRFENLEISKNEKQNYEYEVYPSKFEL